MVEGIEHILFGFNHLLFVASLMLIVRNWRMLVKTVTAFTVAHSITFTFSTLGWVTLPAGLAEVMVAFSIVVVGAEIVRMSACLQISSEPDSLESASKSPPSSRPIPLSAWCPPARVRVASYSEQRNE